MKKKLCVALAVAASYSCNAVPVEFSGCFNDSTLRLDYVFSGVGAPSVDASVSLSELSAQPGWYGRRGNLKKLPLAGNGRLTVRSLDGDTIFRTSFSSIFSEWLALGDSCGRAFEHTVLMPYPKEKAEVSLSLYDSRGEVIASNSFMFSPDDILIKRKGGKRVLPHRYIHKGGDPVRAIDIAILAEGYRPEEMDSFYRHAETAVNEMLSYEPYRSFADRLNFVAVESPSDDSGVSIPRFGDWKSTAFSSHFSTFYSDRYLTTERIFAMNDALEGIPYEHIIVLANTDEYGGAGIFNSYILASARNEHFKPVVVHEFGHSFGGLADEYFYETDVMSDTYPLDIEPWEPNITTLVDFKSKWADMIAGDTPVPTPVSEAGKHNVGVYEGGGYSFKGIYRPADECRMRNNSYPVFCPVCERALSELIRFYTEE